MREWRQRREQEPENGGVRGPAGAVRGGAGAGWGGNGAGKARPGLLCLCTKVPRTTLTSEKAAHLMCGAQGLVPVAQLLCTARLDGFAVLRKTNGQGVDA
jgi:hypothetical protein